MRDDRRALVGERQVTARVVIVIVGIDDEAHRLVGNADVLQSGRDLGRERCKLIVNENNPILTDRGGHIAALAALQQKDIAGYFRYLDLDLTEVLLLCAQNRPHEQQGETNDEPKPHPVASIQIGIEY